MQQFDKQRTRGTQGFGLFDGQFMNMVKATKEDKILKWLVKYDSNLIMFHHRWPTSTENVRKAAHPFSTKDHFGDDQYIMVHNGVVSNSDDLFDKHAEQGIAYSSLLDDWKFNDSEALAWDLALTLEGKQEKLTAKGSIAFVCIKLHKGKLEKLYFGRNSSPLNLFRHKDGIALSSEGEGESIKEDTLYTFNYKLKRLTQKPFEVPSNYVYKPSQDNYYTRRENYGHTFNSSGGLNPYTKGSLAHNAIATSMNNWGNTPTVPYSEDDYDWDDRPGAWIPEETTSRWGSKINTWLQSKAVRQDPETQLFLPADELDDEEVERAKHVSPESKVEQKSLAYLIASEGHFEQAYWQAEFDYDESLDVLENDDSYENLKQVVLLEDVLSYISADPEYKNEKSVSSIWRNLWEQTIQYSK